jgi:hypothetical protein
MSDNVFRTSQPAPAPSTETVTTAPDKSGTNPKAEVEVPYLDYKNEHKKPFSVDYFELGNLWDDRDGGFKSEISIIEDYMFHLIGSGKISNSTEAVREKIRSIEKMAGVSKFETTARRIGKITAFTKFLKDTEEL